METDLNRCSLTVVGAWNLAIFTPQWVAAKLGGQGSTLRLGFLPAGVFTRFDLENAALTVSPGNFQVQPQRDDDGSWGVCERVARIILQVLPETPIQAFGINVGLNLDNTDAVRSVLDLADLAALAGLGGTTEAVAIDRRLRLEGHIVNIHVTRSDNIIRLDANHHFEVGSAQAAVAMLDGAVSRARALTRRIVEAAYGAGGAS